MMQKPLEKWIIQYTWASSCCIVLLLLFFFNILATPLLNSGDDAYFMYTLGGGYGEAPTNLLQYNNGWHPWLGWLVKSLFTWAPGINWYGITLLLFHFAGLSSILYVLLKKLKPAEAIMLFILLFFFIESRLLLSLTFTGAAMVAATGGAVLLIWRLQNKQWGMATVAASLLLVLAGMLRLEVLWLALVLYSPVAVTVVGRKVILRWLICIGAVIMLSAGLNKVHEQYYKKHIAGWEQQEKFRQALFYSYNRQLKADIKVADSVEAELFFAGFLYDSTQFNTERVKAIGKEISRSRSFFKKEDVRGLYWFFIEMRVYILLLLLCAAVLIWKRKLRVLAKWSVSLLTFLGVHIFLFLFLKITLPLHFGLLLFLFLSLFLQLDKGDAFIGDTRLVLFAAAGCLLLLSGWMGYRLYKENADNKVKHTKFLCKIKELNRHPDKLFIATDDAFPLGYVSAWETPQQYPAKNLLYKDRLITHTYLQTLQRFGIANLDEALLHHPAVLLLGKKLPALEKKYKAHLTDTLASYDCLEVRQLRPAE